MTGSDKLVDWFLSHGAKLILIDCELKRYIPDLYHMIDNGLGGKLEQVFRSKNVGSYKIYKDAI